MKNEIKKILYWDLGIPQPPIRIELRPTEKSNLKTLWYSDETVEESSESKEIPREILEKIVRDGCEMGVKEWVISGNGEPMLLRKNLIRSMRTIKQYMCYGELHTNGTMFTPNTVSDIVEMGWDRVSICLPSPEKETNDELSGAKGAFSRVVKGLEMLQDIKEELGVTLPSVEIMMPLLPANFEEVGNMLKFVKRKGVGTLIVKPVDGISQKSGNEELILNEKQIVKFTNHIPRIQSLSRSLRLSTVIHPLKHTEPTASGKRLKKVDEHNIDKKNEEDITGELDPNHLYCLMPFLTMVIGPSGAYGACPIPLLDEETDKNFSLQENFGTHSLNDIWYGHLFALLRDNAKDGPPANYCSKCTPALQKRQRILIKGYNLNRERFMERTLKEIMEEAKGENGNKEIQKRLGEIDDLKLELAKVEERLQTVRGFHIELEKLRSGKIYGLFKALRLFRE